MEDFLLRERIKILEKDNLELREKVSRTEYEKVMMEEKLKEYVYLVGRMYPKCLY